ncbi:isoprenylcysteine carboxylmethyltransferase family protein [bacterium]|nr:isoprenylcysteine carboxylmethyltransferase family protein [bacterium]
MSINEYIKIGWTNGWWFTLVFGLVNSYFFIKYPRDFSRRILKFPGFESVKDKAISFASVVLFTRGMMVYTIFVKINMDSIAAMIGISLFLLALVFYTSALKSFANTSINLPVTSGIYRYSRHPMQVFSLIMWIGVGIATGSWIILAVCFCQPFLAYRFMASQEQFCLEKYGQTYQAYMQKTPRYLGFI